METYKKTVCGFFQDCKKKNLLLIGLKKHDKWEQITTRMDISMLVDEAIGEIQEYRNEQKKKGEEPLLSEKKYDALQFSRSINWLRELIEEFKNSLGLIVDPSKIKPHSELGTYLNQIYDELEYNNEQRIEMSKIFQKNLRNALSHQDYWYDHNEMHVVSITWYDYNTKYIWKQKELDQSIYKIIHVNGIVKKILDGDF